ncbi:MAG TPA: hypothetical protein DDW90_08175 [Cyanobacteria bacterium UBA9971]|nr:hypothetical protein [Cyanobacteria bacterium UBA9971]HCR36145.1 hypothetical protein [Candidatus Woesebacteria bacterium]
MNLLRKMIAYKLFRKRKDQTLAPLFINKRQVIVLNQWLEAEEHQTNGYAFRPGWHCCVKPFAPHLSEKDRAWYKVEIENYEFFTRPESQGGVWVLAQRMKALEEINKEVN